VTEDPVAIHEETPVYALANKESVILQTAPVAKVALPKV